MQMDIFQLATDSYLNLYCGFGIRCTRCGLCSLDESVQSWIQFFGLSAMFYKFGGFIGLRSNTLRTRQAKHLFGFVLLTRFSGDLPNGVPSMETNHK
jgi:hypothetical protein